MKASDIGEIAILTGGDSPEKDVSLKTARSVASSLKKQGIAYKMIYAREDMAVQLKKAPELVFIAMHGGKGENGSIQGLLESLNKTYTGSGVLSSALCMNKIFSKQVFEFNNIKTPCWQYLTGINELQLDFPLVLKPAEGGSTIGTFIVRNKSSFKKAYEKAAEASVKFGGSVMAEQYIPGREITVGILDGKALPLLQIESKREFYDYMAKYEKGMSVHFEPVDIDSKKKKSIQQVAEKAFKVAGCRDMARVDFRLDKDDFYVLEINTIPGMTSTSLLPEAAGIAGIDFDALVFKIIENACLRKKKR
ncbi:MAG: D-alanine--D-alanine ligase family protein [Elusimicrobiota bacterium]